MKAGFGLLALLLSLYLVMTLVQQQTRAVLPPQGAEAAPTAPAQRVQQVQQDVQRALDEAAQLQQRQRDAALDAAR